MNLRFLIRGFGWLTLAALLAVTGTAYGRSGTDGLTQAIDGYTVTLAIAAPPARTGSNDLVVTIHDTSGASVDDATVTAAVLAYTATDEGHADTHTEGNPDESHAGGSAEPHGDSQTAGSAAYSHSDDHSGDGHRHEAIATLLERGTQAGVYRAPLFLDTPGIATLSVTFTLRETTRSAIFDVAVVQTRPRALVLGGFAAVNTLAIVSAALLKRSGRHKRRARAANTRAPFTSTSALPRSTQEDRPA